MAENHLHHVVGPASMVSDATTIFDASVEPRFVDLRAMIKELSKAFKSFISRRQECAATAIAVGDLTWDQDNSRDDMDSERVFFALNLNNWICGAHAVLDPNNDYDREMLKHCFLRRQKTKNLCRESILSASK